MSLASTANRNDYLGNSSVSAYSYTFRIFSSAHLRAIVRDLSGVETVLVIGTDYTVSGVGAVGGGTLSLVNAAQSWLNAGNLKTGYALTIRRVVPLTQNTSVRNQGAYFPEIHEDTFDSLVMIDQQQEEELARSVTLPQTVAPSAFNPTLPANITTAVQSALCANSAGTGFIMVPLAGGGVGSPAGVRPIKKISFADSPYSVDPTADYDIVADPTDGNILIVAPSAALNPKFEFRVLRIVTLTNTISVTSADLINGAGSFSVAALLSDYAFKTDGSTYYVY